MHESQVLARLRQVAPHLRPSGPATRLSGGLLNHVFRIPCDPIDVVLKFTPGHVASNPDIPLDPSRGGFEAAALQILGTRAPSICVPRLIAHDPESSTLVLEYVPSTGDLTDAIAQGLPIADLLATLGRSLAALHMDTYHDDEIAGLLDNRAVQEARLEVQYAGVAGWLEGRVPESMRLAAGARALALGQRLTRHGRCMIMGDLWPASVLVTPSGEPCLIDWEFSHFGDPCQDVGHLNAHLGLWGARDAEVFERAYRQVLGTHPLGAPEARALWRVHEACERLIRWVGPFADPRLSWGEEDVTRAARVLAG